MNSYQRIKLANDLVKYRERMDVMVSEYITKGNGSFTVYNKPEVIGYITQTAFKAHVKNLVKSGKLVKKGFDFRGERLYGYSP